MPAREMFLTDDHRIRKRTTIQYIEERRATEWSLARQQSAFACIFGTMTSETEKARSRPARSSSRISGLPKPSYAEREVISEPLPPKSPSRIEPSTEHQLQDIVQRWSWQATAELPMRDNAGTLHFDGHPDVSPTSPTLM